MTLRKKLAIALAVFAAVAVIVGLTGIAATSYGTQNDPLVTLSYINETLTPALKLEIAAAVANSEKTLTANLESKISEFETDISSMISSSSSASASTFSLVSLSKGQVMSCGVGTEIMLRLGSAVSNGGSSPRLVNETDATSVTAAGTALVKNNLYMVTIQKNGIKATANGTKVLVRGSYTIG